MRTIAWETYHDSGALKSMSKSHLVVGRKHGYYTLCGIYYGDKISTYDNDLCGRCVNKYNKENPDNRIDD